MTSTKEIYGHVFFVSHHAFEPSIHDPITPKMKRILGTNTTEENARVLATLPSPSDGLVDILSVLDIKEIFRMHPMQLIRILNTNSTAISKMIASKEKEEHYFWYHIAKFSFPDICIALNERRMARDELPDDVEYGAILFMTTSVWRTTRRGFSFSYLDRSFTESAVLERCLADRLFARGVLAAMRGISPFGVPPAQYYTLSHMRLREIALRFVLLMVNVGLGPSQASNWLKGVCRRNTFAICSSDSKYATLDECMRRVKPSDTPIPDTIARGEGPLEASRRRRHRDTDNKFEIALRPIQPHRLFSFFHLFQDITELIDEYRAFKTLDKRSRAFVASLESLRHDALRLMCLFDLPIDRKTTADIYAYFVGISPPNVTISRDTMQIELSPIIVERELRVAKYGTDDPLLYEMLVEEDTTAMSVKDEKSGNPEWRTVIVDQIEWLRVYRGTNDTEYLNISASCHQCGHSGLESLYLEPVAPYNVFCGADCHTSCYTPK